MKIRCIKNLARDVTPESIAHYTSLDSSVPLVLDKEYIVYAVSEYYQSVWYCICDESYTYHPMWIPQDFFKLIDNRISRYWVFSFKEDLKKNRFFFGFSEWANQLDFYDNYGGLHYLPRSMHRNGEILYENASGSAEFPLLSSIGLLDWSYYTASNNVN